MLSNQNVPFKVPFHFNSKAYIDNNRQNSKKLYRKGHNIWPDDKTGFFHKEIGLKKKYKDITFTMNPENNENSPINYQSLKHLFNHQPNLKHLVINPQADVSPKRLWLILEQLQKRNNITNLTIYFNFINLNNAHIQCLIHALSKLKHLTSLSLIGIEINDNNKNTIHLLRQGFASLQQLTKLKLNYANSCHETWKGSNHLLSLTLKDEHRFSKLNELNFTVIDKRTNSENEFLSLPKLDKLKRLSLHFDESLGDSEMELIATGLIDNRLPNLIHFTYDSLFNQFLYSSRMEKPNLHLMNTETQDESLTVPSQLKSINLNLSENNKITNAALAHLPNLLSQHPKLGKLTLNLNKCENITSQGFDYVLQALDNSYSLRRLVLKLNTNHFNPSQINELKEKLAKRPTLTNLEISIIHYRKDLSDSYIENLSCALSSLPKLTKLDISISNSNDLSNESLDHLKKMKSELPENCQTQIILYMANRIHYID